MITVDSIEKGIVIDHIKAGKSMEIYQALNLDELDCSVAIIKNVKSNKMGFKDIIKISDTIDLNITVNIIEDGRRIEKKRLELPEKVVNVAHCKNPRCITSIEQELDHVFRLADRERGIYRCIYCDQKPGKEQ